MGLFKRSKEHDDLAGLSSAQRRQAKKDRKERDKTLLVRNHQLVDAIPHSGYRFHSNYFEYGSRFGRILTLVESEQADRDKDPFWRILLIPQSGTLNDKPGDDVELKGETVFGAHGQFFDMLENKSKKWAGDRQRKTESHVQMEGSTADGATEVNKIGTRKFDNQLIAMDRAAGDMYGSTEFKVLITARSLDDLDLATFRYSQWISSQFDGTRFEVYEGQQEADFTNLLRTADVQLGQHPMGTSSEYAGGYDIMTRGITDLNGDMLGVMVGDMNNTAVLMDMDNYDDRVIIAHSAQAQTVKLDAAQFEAGTRSTTLLGVRLAQAALINNHRVIHMVMNGSKPQDIGADLSDITTVLALNGGQADSSINPFELFGDNPAESEANRKKQFSYFAPHINKLKLMIKQLSPEVDNVDLNEVFTNIIQDFYKNHDMLVDNPQENYQQLKLIGLAHEQYPKLDEFITYLNQRMNAASENNNQRLVGRIERIRSAFNAMYRDNPDLFNTITNSAADSAKQMPQVIYDFSSLRKRGISVAMAQFINVLQYATDSLVERDVLIIHGVDQIDKSVKDYVSEVFRELTQNGVRIVFLYDDTTTCIEDSKFNRLSYADWTMLGGFKKPVITAYQQMIQKKLPMGLSSAILNWGNGGYGDEIYYLSRGIDNVLLALDVKLGTRNGGMVSEHPKGLNATSISK